MEEVTMRFQVACEKHLEQIMAITNEAKAQLKRMGVDQWQKGYPSLEVWQQDIAQGNAYVVLDDETDAVMGAFSYLNTRDASYDEIEGSWLTGDCFEDGRYASLHRVCVADRCKGQGVVGRMYQYASDLAKAQGIASLRIDTHPDNKPMIRSLEKAGFTQCGSIALVGGVEDGQLRIAFEKVW